MSDGVEIAATKASEIGFRAFWLLVAQELSHARLHLDANATSLDSFIKEDSDVRAYLHRAIKRSYKESRCQHLNSPLVIETLLDTLGETAYQIQQDRSGDLFDVELLEEIAWLICDRFASQVTELLARCNAWTPPTQQQSAQVVSFPDFKIRRANARL